MFYKKEFNNIYRLINEIDKKINTQHNRIDKISDYIQEKLLNEIIKADDKFIMEGFEREKIKILDACKSYIDMKLNKKPSKKKGK